MTAMAVIASDRLTPHMVSPPVDLVRNDLILNQAPVPDDTLVEIVDRIFLPLVSGRLGGPEPLGRSRRPARTGSAPRRPR